MPDFPAHQPADFSTFDTVQKVLEHSSLSKEDRSFVLAGQWTLDQVPEIKSDDEYRRCLEIHHRLSSDLDSKLPPREDPTWGEAWTQSVQSREGMIVTALGARLAEWEQEQG